MSQRFDLGGLAVAGLFSLALGCVKGTEIVDGQVIVGPVDTPDASAGPTDASSPVAAPSSPTPNGSAAAPAPAAPAAPSPAPAASGSGGAPGSNASTPSVIPAPGANAASTSASQPDAGLAPAAPVLVPAVVDAGFGDAGSAS